MTTFATPPLPGVPRHAILPAPLERTLANGLRVIAFQQVTGPKALGVPLIAAQLIVRAGGANEPEGQAGLAHLTATLMSQGTATKSASQIAQAIDALGARLDASSGFDAMVVSVSATTPVFERAFALFDEVARTPAFTDADFLRVRTKAIGDLGLTYSNPSALARLTANRVAYGDAPYGHPLSGTAETLGALTREDVAAFHARWFRPDNAVLVLGGDLPIEVAFAYAEREFGAWQRPAQSLPAQRAFTPIAPASRIVVIDKPDAGRTAVLVGRVAIARRSPEYFAGNVATAVLAGYSGRLNQEIRVKRGLSYGASAQLVTRREPGMFLASTLVDHSKAVETVGVVRETLAELAQTPVSPEGLVPRKATITGSFYRGVETIDGIAGTIGESALYDIPLAALADYVPAIEAIAPDDIQRFAHDFIAHDTFAILVGDASVFGTALSAAYADVQTIAFEDLDLNRATLVREG
jgi:zinc protease